MKNISVKKTGRVVPFNQLPNSLSAHFGKLAIATKDSIELIAVDQIIYFKAESNYTLIKLENGATHLTSVTLKKYVTKFAKSAFVKVHQSYFINSNYIKKFELKNNLIILENETQIPVSRSSKKALLLRLRSMMA